MKKPLIVALVFSLSIPLMPQALAAEASAVCAPPVRKKTIQRSVRKITITPRPASATIAPDAFYQQALLALRNGRVAEAQGLLQQQLQRQASHEAARALLATLHLESGRRSEAESLLQEGLQRNPANTNTAMTLARLQAERGALPLARATLARSAGNAAGNGAYWAFMAVLAQKAGEHHEAHTLLERALKIQPGTGVWLLAQAQSSVALHNEAGARTAYQAALASGQLTPAQKNQAHRGLASLAHQGD